ncbi:MAG: sulfite exporter TauE/SafE family protein [Rhodospirillales bacterium]|nr:sulfite exporter TauE/SafE family protein [Rhodospirillales bacterium]
MDLSHILNSDLAIAGAVAVVAAMLRGFTGFGANLIWGPVLLFLWGPVEMVAIMGLTGMVASVQACIPEIRKADWPEITPMVIAAIIAAPLGVYALIHLNPEIVRRSIGGFILAIALILATGWRYRGERSLLPKIVTGGVAGGLAGFAGIGGPICVLYFMAAPGAPEIQRANNMISVSALVPVVLLTLAITGDIGVVTLIRAAVLLAPYSLGVWLGARLFYMIPKELFRRAVLALLMVIGIAVMAA